MNALDELFGASADLESGAGIVLNYGAAGSFTIHRAGGSNRRFEMRREALLKPYTRQLQTNTMDDAVAQDIFVKLYAETVIVDWSGVPNEDGTGEREFTKENVAEVLTRYPDLFADIRIAASDRSLFLAKNQQVIEGNSQAPSGGKSGGARKRIGSKA